MSKQDANAAYNAAYDHGFRAGAAVSADRIEALEAALRGWNMGANRLTDRIEVLEAALLLVRNCPNNCEDCHDIARAAFAPDRTASEMHEDTFKYLEPKK